MKFQSYFGLLFPTIACVAWADQQTETVDSTKTVENSLEAKDAPQTAGDGVGEKLDLAIFEAQPNNEKIYLTPAPIKVDLFTKVGFVKSVRVFGIPMIATEQVTAEDMAYGARVLASILDNDNDGVPDNKAVVDHILAQRLIVGYTVGDEDSQRIWDASSGQDSSTIFQSYFSKKFQFFEQWTVDMSPGLSAVKKQVIEIYEGKAPDTFGIQHKSAEPFEKDSQECKILESTGFDWSKIHLPFAIFYYASTDLAEPSLMSELGNIVAQSVADEKYRGVDSVKDKDMEIPNFLAWVHASVHGELICFQDVPEFQDWKLSTKEKILEYNPRILEILDMIPGMPKGPLEPNDQNPSIVN